MPTQPAYSSLPAAGRAPDGWVSDFATREARARVHTKLLIWGERLALLAVALGIWQLLAGTNVISTQTVGDPSGVISYFFGSLIEQASFWHDVLVTAIETIVGLVCGIVAGTIIGIALGLTKRLASAFQPLIVGLNAVPKVALAPLAVVWLGLGVQSKIAIAAFSAFFVIFFNVMGGLANLDQTLIQNARMLGMSRLRVLSAVTLPSIGVWVITASKVAISLAVVGAVVGEYIGASAGLGYSINQAINTVQVTRMVGLLIAVALVGCTAYAAVSVIERTVLRWR
jgi:sulfonate transport system permease protein